MSINQSVTPGFIDLATFDELEKYQVLILEKENNILDLKFQIKDTISKIWGIN